MASAEIPASGSATSSPYHRLALYDMAGPIRTGGFICLGLIRAGWRPGSLLVRVSHCLPPLRCVTGRQGAPLDSWLTGGLE